MIIVVEVASGAGSSACKEYDAPTLTAAVEAAKHELREGENEENEPDVQYEWRNPT